MKKDLSKKFESVKAVLFDMDGIVVDSDHLHDEAKRAAVKFYGFKISEDDWEKIKHQTTSCIYKWLHQIQPEMEVTEEEFLKYKTDYFAKFAKTKIELVPGVIDFAQSLKRRGVKLALVTSTRRTAFNIFRNKFSLDKYFEVMICEDDVKNLKPHPEPYLKAIKLLDLKPHNCAVIEDAVNGVISGKSAGCLVFGRATTVSGRSLLSAGADVSFKNFADFIN